MAHGNLIGQGPGFGSGAYDWVSRMLQRYNKTSLFRQTGPFGTESVHLREPMNCVQMDKPGNVLNCTLAYTVHCLSDTILDRI